MHKKLYTSTDMNFARDTEQWLVLVDFSAEWCGPCQIMKPIITAFAQTTELPVKVMKHDVDTEPQIPAQLRIRSIPTMMLFRDSTPVGSLVGVQSEAHLESLIRNHL